MAVAVTRGPEAGLTYPLIAWAERPRRNTDGATVIGHQTHAHACPRISGIAACAGVLLGLLARASHEAERTCASRAGSPACRSTSAIADGLRRSRHVNPTARGSSSATHGPDQSCAGDGTRPGHNARGEEYRNRAQDAQPAREHRGGRAEWPCCCSGSAWALSADLLRVSWGIAPPRRVCFRKVSSSPAASGSCCIAA
jgi:hypothetical protein